jgi:hypothetical protein
VVRSSSGFQPPFFDVFLSYDSKDASAASPAQRHAQQQAAGGSSECSVGLAPGDSEKEKETWTLNPSGPAKNKSASASPEWLLARCMPRSYSEAGGLFKAARKKLLFSHRADYLGDTDALFASPPLSPVCFSLVNRMALDPGVDLGPLPSRVSSSAEAKGFLVLLAPSSRPCRSARRERGSLLVLLARLLALRGSHGVLEGLVVLHALGRLDVVAVVGDAPRREGEGGWVVVVEALWLEEGLRPRPRGRKTKGQEEGRRHIQERTTPALQTEPPHLQPSFTLGAEEEGGGDVRGCE